MSRIAGGVGKSRRISVFFGPPCVYPIRMFTVAETIRSMGDIENWELARGLRGREPELLDRLVETYQYRLFRYLMFLTGNRQTAEELFQETWVRVLEKGHLYNGKSRFEPWLFSVAHNLFVDMLRRRKSARILEEIDNPQDGNGPEWPVAVSRSPVEELMREEEAGVVAAAAGSLPAGIREVLVLRFHEDLSLEEIADIVSSPISTVKSRLYRGLELMRSALEGVRK